MKQHTSEYSQRVDKWLAEHGIECKIERIGSTEGFPGEKPGNGDGNGNLLSMHDTYRATFTRTDAKLQCFKVPLFHQSAAHSESELVRAKCSRGCGFQYREPMRHSSQCAANPANAESPSAYDILACVTKNDPGTFSDFCGDYGYDEDSRMAERTYFAVQHEWKQARAFFTAEELEELAEVAS